MTSASNVSFGKSETIIGAITLYLTALGVAAALFQLWRKYRDVPFRDQIHELEGGIVLTHVSMSRYVNDCI